MSSVSSSECCNDTPACLCADWLTITCDREEVSIEACGDDGSLSFEQARVKSVPLETAGNQTGIFTQDMIFEVSDLEQEDSFSILPGQILNRVSDESIWTIYRVVHSDMFCVWKLWARNVASCYQLLERCDIQYLDCSCEDCGEQGKWITVKKNVRMSLMAETGRVRAENDRSKMVVNYVGRLERWPLKGLPHNNHRIVIGSDRYRILGFTNGGLMAPFTVTLDRVDADCSLPG